MSDNSTPFNRMRGELEGAKIAIAAESIKPWGGFFVINDASLGRFVDRYFPGLLSADERKLPLSPKILMVKPGARLSWQWHHRRAEVWRVVDGPVQLARSDDDTQDSADTLENGTVVRLPQGERHRLIGVDGWGVVAEIWQHTDQSNLSDEDDIVRVQDDYGRG